MNRVKFPDFLVPKVCGPGVLVTVSCLILFGLLPAYGNQSPSVRVAIVVSKHISPYLEAVEGIEVGLAGNPEVKTQVFSLEKLDDKERVGLFGGEGVKEFALFVAVGPEAAQYLWEGIGKKGASTIYCMVLNPEKVIGEKERGCGIPLNIPVQTQIEMISRGFPSVRRVGLLYDPEHNSEFLRKAAGAASFLNLTVVPLKVSSKKDIPSALESQWKHMDALWLIPDRTVISESIVNYLIKEAFLRKVPVIGYNRFFYEAGAALAFVFDYKELGQQCAQKALRVLLGENCQDTSPFFHVWVNEKVAEKLGLMTSDGYLPPLELGP
jgi:putative ABC transport system substrate-binding protein